MADVSCPAKNSVEIWSRNEVSLNSGCAVLLRGDQPREDAAILEPRLAMLGDVAVDAGIELGYCRVERVEFLLGNFLEQRHQAARREWPVFLALRGHLAEALGDRLEPRA